MDNHGNWRDRALDAINQGRPSDARDYWRKKAAEASCNPHLAESEREDAAAQKKDIDALLAPKTIWLGGSACGELDQIPKNPTRH